ncbi:hypothetical protein DAEQUDRAFT_659031, partial [Daedalea quercina L-15889]
IRLTLRWVPGHRDVTGNERADTEAKEAARRNSSPAGSLPRWLTTTSLPASVSKVRQALYDNIKSTAKTEWKKSPRAAKLDRIDPGLPSPSY